MDPLALDPLGPTGFDLGRDRSPGSDPLALDPLSPVETDVPRDQPEADNRKAST
jgi:hypothetical protein